MSWREVECPSCGAPPGLLCGAVLACGRRQLHGTHGRPHVARVRAAASPAPPPFAPPLHIVGSDAPVSAEVNAALDIVADLGALIAIVLVATWSGALDRKRYRAHTTVCDAPAAGRPGSELTPTL